MPRSAQATEEFLSRERRLIDAARSIAESEGWQAVSVRRLASEIGFSQPILYRHFPRGREEIVERVVLEGFEELAAAVQAPGQGGDVLENIVVGYLRFARLHPAVYEAMSTALTSIVFASDETPQVLRDGFDAIKRGVALDDDEKSVVRTELLWSLLHGVSQLSRFGRLPVELEEARVAEILRLFRPSR